MARCQTHKVKESTVTQKNDAQTDSRELIEATELNLQEALEGSYYTIRGAGGELADWTRGYDNLLEERGIGRPVAWYHATGQQINEFAAAAHGGAIRPDDCFPADLNLLFFPLEGLETLPIIFKIERGDVWFDDMIANMRRAR